MIKPCLIEHGMDLTSMTLSEPMMASGRILVFIRFLVSFCFLSLSSHAKHGAAKFSHHGRIPRRVPDDVYPDVTDTVEMQQRVLCSETDAFMHGTARGGEGHGDGYV